MGDVFALSNEYEFKLFCLELRPNRYDFLCFDEELNLLVEVVPLARLKKGKTGHRGVACLWGQGLMGKGCISAR